jgi:hypothetical protein
MVVAREEEEQQQRWRQQKCEADVMDDQVAGGAQHGARRR